MKWFEISFESANAPFGDRRLLAGKASGNA